MDDEGPAQRDLKSLDRGRPHQEPLVSQPRKRGETELSLHAKATQHAGRYFL
jgi:hypothetical protein